jgi:hypothetical protein
LSHQWERLQNPGVPAVSGLGGTFNTELDHQFLSNASHQAVALVGVNVGWGHTGRVQALGAPDFATVSPLINFGKGFGDLPESLTWLRPWAITGNLSVDFPTKTQSAERQTQTLSIMVLRSSTALSCSSITCGMSGVQPHSTG